MTIRHTTTFATLGISVALATLASAQQQPLQQQPGQPARPGVQVQVNSPHARMMAPQVTQEMMASCVAIANQEEVAIARFASQKAKNSDVKSFAKTLIEDHQAFLKKLERFTPEAREGALEQASHSEPADRQGRGTIQQTAAVEQQEERQRAGNARQAQPGQQAQPGAQANQQAGGLDVIQLDREIAQQCISNAKKKLSEVDSDRFDHCFIGHQIAAHEAMVTKLSVLKRHCSGELAQLLEDGIETTNKHLKEAEKIMDKLPHKDGDHDDKSRNEKNSK